MKNKERLRLTMLTQRKNLEQMLDRISKATECVSTYDHSILDAMYERIEDRGCDAERGERRTINRKFGIEMKKIWQWIRIDGLLHIETSALMVVAMSIVMPVWTSAVITMSVGIIKEGWDIKHGGTPEMHDIWCDTIGMCLGVILEIL